MKRCPCCHQEIPETRAGVKLSAKKLRIFDYVRSHPGQSGRDIAAAIWDRSDHNGVVLVRVHIQQINDLLEGTGVRLRGAKGWGYRVDGLAKQPKPPRAA